MKTLFIVGVLTLTSFAAAQERVQRGRQQQQKPTQQTSLQSTELPELEEGHWYSQRPDRAKGLLITFENWFSRTEEGKLKHESKEVAREPLPPEIVAPAPVTPVPEAPVGRGYVCYSHDYVKEHSVNDPEDDACRGFYFRGRGSNLRQAKNRSLAACMQRSDNKETCTIFIKKNCFSEKLS